MNWDWLMFRVWLRIRRLDDNLFKFETYLVRDGWVTSCINICVVLHIDILQRVVTLVQK